jgi:2-polyprenyl-3-methyl-5-hydroxy-6-metoxy-1,4-benzoquinol methylase
MVDGARLRKQERMNSHGWFDLPDSPGDRTLSQQMTGLGNLIAEVSGKTVLDVGCAEGLIGIECLKAGASHLVGVELVKKHIDKAKVFGRGLECAFFVADANQFRPQKTYDIVLLLAILHKLRNPTEACLRLADAASDLCVIRMGINSKNQVISDPRSEFEPHDIGAAMESLGFSVECVAEGPFGEATWYYRRGER